MRITDKLTESQQHILEFYDLPESQLSKTYGPGKWTVKQILVHLTDAESVLLNRIKRVIAEPRQVVWAFDQDLWCEHLDYTNFPLELSRSAFVANRQQIIYLASLYFESLGYKEFVHSETGVRTLKDEFDKVVIHCQSHIDQIKMAIS